MALRTQRQGKQKHWTLNELKSGLAQFYSEHDRYPTASEVNRYSYLPSARSIERSFGGLVRLRKHLDLKGQSDFRNGEHSKARAQKINARSHALEKEVYEYLCKKFKKEFVHREYFFTDDRRTRSDFFVYDSKTGFCVDIFYPSDRHNLIGCLNSKLKKYGEGVMRQYPVVFLQMNKDIPERVLDTCVRNKKNKLPPGQQLMGWETFQVFIGSRRPRL